MDLHWHHYHYYPYERELAMREVRTLLSTKAVSEIKQGIRLEGNYDTKAIERLVYFAEATNGDQSFVTMQARLERVNGNGLNRQSTRYSAHGLHEYKGKFNPQIARAILNILHLPIGARILDPFCGSGTSLVECSHLGMRATGTDINPLAVFIANAKISVLKLPVLQLQRELELIVNRYKSSKPSKENVSDERVIYLQNWFDPEILTQIEKLRIVIEKADTKCAPSFLSIASNLLRDYSLQDPHDLRIRRRKSPIPQKPFIESFNEAANHFFLRIENAQIALANKTTACKAILLDSRLIKLGIGGLGKAKFDCALTSPPYATALPYIDTQRLSLVWLKLLPPSEIHNLEARLTGSREVRGESKKDLLSALMENRSDLPKEQADYCRMLQKTLSDTDGFRRQAVPLLLYRYFVDMANMFKKVRSCMNDEAPFALIVGSNHTVLGGKRFDITTPSHLVEIACSCGWTHEETVPLQTYQRYGYHMSNAVNSESLVIVRAA